MPRAKDAGVTLVETLVVLALISVSITVAIVALVPGGGRRAAADAAEQFAHKLERAGERAFFTGSTVDLSWNSVSYAFRAQDGSLLAEHQLPATLELRTASPAARYTILPDGTSAPERWWIGSDRNLWKISFDGLSASTEPVQ